MEMERRFGGALMLECLVAAVLANSEDLSKLIKLCRAESSPGWFFRIQINCYTSEKYIMCILDKVFRGNGQRLDVAVKDRLPLSWVLGYGHFKKDCSEKITPNLKWRQQKSLRRKVQLVRQRRSNLLR